MTGPLAKKELLGEGCSCRNGKQEESSKQKKISDDRQHYDKWTESTAVGQAVECVPVTQRARVRTPVEKSFLGEVSSGFFFTCKTNVGKL